MHLLLFYGLFVIFLPIHCQTDLEKYSALREQCARHPSNVECVQLKVKFLQLIQKCQKIQSKEQLAICQQVKLKLCAVFPSYCLQLTTITTTKPKITKSKFKSTKKTMTTTTTTTVKTTITSTMPMANEEFVKVPVDPNELRIRGEYCVRHGKEKKCQQLLNNLKNTYSNCNKKKATPQPEQIDCHSFQTHLCKAFPKFPPCIKKTT